MLGILGGVLGGAAVLDHLFFESWYALGTHVSLISDIMRVLFYFFDSLIYVVLVPTVYNLIYSLYDISFILTGDVAHNIVLNFSKTVYSFLAIVMFFKAAISLLTMLVDPSVIEDKEKGIKKLFLNIFITLVMIIVVPIGFQASRRLQTAIIQGNMIEKIVIGEDFEKNRENYSLGKEFPLTVWSIFFTDIDGVTKDGVRRAYECVFNDTNCDEKANATLKLQKYINFTTKPSVGNIARIPIFGKILLGGDDAPAYQLSYVWLFSTIAGVFVLWTFIKMMIDVAYRSIKFYVLELLSPIAIVSYVDPKSAKSGLFKKWLDETVKTYLSLFIRIFVLAVCSILFSQISLAELNNSAGLFSKIFIILAAIAFFKNGPKFIDELFGTKTSQGSDAKLGQQLLGGLIGGTTSAVAGGISGAVAAKATGRSVFKGAVSGVTQGFKKGSASAKKGGIGGMVGVVTGGIDTVKEQNKKYGYNRDREYEKDYKTMEEAVVNRGKPAKNAAIAAADANNGAAIRAEFTRGGRMVNGYEVKYDNLVGNAEAEGMYKKFVASIAETRQIPKLSDKGKVLHANAEQKGMYAKLSRMQATMANSELSSKTAAFLSKDSTGKNFDITDMFNRENARRLAAGETALASWQDMFAQYGGSNYSSATITVEDAYDIALNHEIKLRTGHNVAEWNNIAGKDESDAQAAKDAIKVYEASPEGQADARYKKIYGEAKGQIDAQGYTGP